MKLIGAKAKRDWHYLSAISLLLVVTWLVFVIRSNEPSYQGESLSQWLDGLPDLRPELQGDSQWRRGFRHMCSDTNRLTRLFAINALRHIDKRPDLVSPALAERLTDKDAVIRNYASSAMAGITNASHERTAAELLECDRPATNGRSNDFRKPPTPLKSPNPYE